MRHEQAARDILDFFNLETGKNFAPRDYNLRKVSELIDLNYSVDQIKSVIVTANNLWRDSEKMRHCIKPDTIFKPEKFEGILNEAGLDSLDAWVRGVKNTEISN
jgi:uncharacterized phage protein (TIGR02220 family)